MGCHFLLQGIFPTQELNPGVLHCRQILYQLSYKGNLFYRNPYISCLHSLNLYFHRLAIHIRNQTVLNQSSPLTPPTPSFPQAKGRRLRPYPFLAGLTDSARRFLYLPLSLVFLTQISFSMLSSALSLPGLQNWRGESLPHCLRTEAPTIMPSRHSAPRPSPWPLCNHSPTLDMFSMLHLFNVQMFFEPLLCARSCVGHPEIN